MTSMVEAFGWARADTDQQSSPHTIRLLLVFASELPYMGPDVIRHVCQVVDHRPHQHWRSGLLCSLPRDAGYFAHIFGCFGS